MVNLTRAVYTVAYYWSGLPKKAIHSVLWLYDKVYNTELLTWTNVNNLPYSSLVQTTLNELIIDGQLRITNKWSKLYGLSGVECVKNSDSPDIYRDSDRFTNEFRRIVKYLLMNQTDFRNIIIEYASKPIDTQSFFNDMTVLMYRR